MYCTQPFGIYKHRGHQGVFNPDTGQVERAMVACGQCPTCIAGRKNDWTGRLCAEALKAKEVYFLTMTYKHEQERFDYSHVQRMLYLLRTHMTRYGQGQRIRYFCVGERGNLHGRIHWHMLIFADAPLGWLPWNKQTQAGKLWDYWPWGWTQIDPVARHDIVARVRYVAKYAVKKIGDENATRARFSTKPMIGGEYILDHAIRVAEAGLPLNGWYTLPGHIWNKGPRKGQAVKYRLKGASARRACEAYMDAWETIRPDRPWYDTAFLAHYGDAQMMRRIANWPDTAMEMEWCRAPVTPWRVTHWSDPVFGNSIDIRRDLGRHQLAAPKEVIADYHRLLER